MCEESSARVRHRTVQVVKAEVSWDDTLRDDLPFLHPHVAHQVMNPLNDSVPSSWSGNAVATYHPCHSHPARVNGGNEDEAVNIRRRLEEQRPAKSVT